MDNKLAYTIPELVEASGVGRTSIYYEIKVGRLKTIKRGRRTLVPADWAKAWIDGLKQQSEAA